MIILRSTGPVISTRRSRRSAGAARRFQSPARTPRSRRGSRAARRRRAALARARASSSASTPHDHGAKARRAEARGGAPRRSRSSARRCARCGVEGLSQAQLAERLGISASYLNLIENNHRPLPAALLIKLAQLFGVDLQAFAGDDDATLGRDLLEVVLRSAVRGVDAHLGDVRELVRRRARGARAVLTLYRAYQSARETRGDARAAAREGDGLSAWPRSRCPRGRERPHPAHMNHFPELEEAAEPSGATRARHRRPLAGPRAPPRARPRRRRLHRALGARSAGRCALRRERGDAHLSELLPTRSRTFQLAHQIGLLEAARALDALVVDDPRLTTDEARALARVALANYFAGAVLMPYDAVPRGRAERALRHRRHGPALPRGLRAGVPPVHDAAAPGGEGVPST
jgi:transcriptional regulator with XRE-family HTH domain